MSDSDQSTANEETPSKLREIIEAKAAEAREARTALVTEVTGAFKYVKPDDLANVPIGELKAKATELEQAKAAEREALLLEELQARGIDPSIISQPAVEQETTADRLASVGSLGGIPSRQQADPNLSGRDKIKAAIDAANAKHKR